MIGYLFDKIQGIFLSDEKPCRLSVQFETNIPVVGYPLIAEIELERIEPVDIRWYRVLGNKKYSKYENLEEYKKEYFCLISRSFCYTPVLEDIGHSLVFMARAKLSRTYPESEVYFAFEKCLQRIPSIPVMPILKNDISLDPKKFVEIPFSVSSMNFMGFLFPEDITQKFRNCEGKVYLKKLAKIYWNSRDSRNVKLQSLFNITYRKLLLLEEIRSRNSDIFSVNHIHPSEIDFFKKQLRRMGYSTFSTSYDVRTKSFFSEDFDGFFWKEKESRKLFSMIAFKSSKFEEIESFELSMNEIINKRRNLPTKVIPENVKKKKIQFIKLEQSQSFLDYRMFSDLSEKVDIGVTFQELNSSEIFMVSNIFFTPEESEEWVCFQLDILNKYTIQNMNGKEEGGVSEKEKTLKDEKDEKEEIEGEGEEISLGFDFATEVNISFSSTSPSSSSSSQSDSGDEENRESEEENFRYLKQKQDELRKGFDTTISLVLGCGGDRFFKKPVNDFISERLQYCVGNAESMKKFEDLEVFRAERDWYTHNSFENRRKSTSRISKNLVDIADTFVLFQPIKNRLILKSISSIRGVEKIGGVYKNFPQKDDKEKRKKQERILRLWNEKFDSDLTYFCEGKKYTGDDIFAKYLYDYKVTDEKRSFVRVLTQEMSLEKKYPKYPNLLFASESPTKQMNFAILRKNCDQKKI